MRVRFSLSAFISAAAVITAIAGPVSALPFPAGAAHVPVTAGKTTNVPVELKTGGIIRGVVEVRDPHPAAGLPTAVQHAQVFAFLNGRVINSSYTDSNGQYSIGGLPRSTAGYQVCVSALGVRPIPAKVGVVSRCAKNVAWTPPTNPAGETIPLRSGQTLDLKFSLPKAGLISGTITSPQGVPLRNATVLAGNRGTGQGFKTVTNKKGQYALAGLPNAAKGYDVCVDSGSVGNGFGFTPACYAGTPWIDRTRFPAAADAVAVTPGARTGGINMTLKHGADISGTVTDVTTDAPLAGMPVAVFTPTGVKLRTATTDADGQYVLRGVLPAKALRVCISAHGVAPGDTYLGQCWQAVAWDGRVPLPPAATGVPATRGKETTGIDFALTEQKVDLGSIAGTVTTSADKPLLNADVVVYGAGGTRVTSAITGAKGKYTIGDLPPGSYTVCVHGESAHTAADPSPTYTWAPECYDNVRWDGGTVPAAATTVTLTEGQAQTGVDIALVKGGAISGRVLSAAGADPIAHADVYLYDLAGNQLGHVASASKSAQKIAPPAGSFAFEGLRAMATSKHSGYVVCINTRRTTGSITFIPTCLKDVTWITAPSG